MNRFARRSFFLATALTAAAGAAQATVVTFFDGDLVGANWTIFTMMSGNGGTTTSTLVTTDGNPPNCRQIDDVINGAPGPTQRSTVWAIHLRNGATYNPATQGSIGHICYTEWVKRITAAGDVQSVGPAIRQGGTVFVASIGNAQSVPWAPRIAAVTQADFIAIDPTDLVDGLNQASHPNFATTGGVIELGFYHGNSTGLGNPAYSTMAFVDNWTLTIVPGPVCPADLNGDGVVSAADLAIILGSWGGCP